MRTCLALGLLATLALFAALPTAQAFQIVSAEGGLPNAALVCHVTTEGVDCEGFYCWSDPSSGKLPVDTGKLGNGSIGTGVSLHQDQNGNWGPYTGLYVDPNGHC